MRAGEKRQKTKDVLGDGIRVVWMGNLQMIFLRDGVAGGLWQCYVRREMGIQERDYWRKPQETYRNRYLAQLTPVVKVLLGLNIVVSVLDFFVLPFVLHREGQWLTEWGAFTMQRVFDLHRFETLITFQYLHAGMGHLVLNMMGLFFFGPWMERWWGRMRFLLFYSLCGAAGAIFYTLLAKCGILHDGIGYGGQVISVREQGLIGASAGLYGILVGVAVIEPALRVSLIFPPVTTTMRRMAIGLMGISTVMVLLSLGGNEGGEAGHLGGALMGGLLMYCPWLLGKITKKQPIRMESTPMRAFDPYDEQVDRILEKVNEQGLHMLTDEEKRILHEASKRYRS